MWSDSIERNGRVGDFQCRFRRGRIPDKKGSTVVKRPEGSVYSTRYRGKLKCSIGVSRSLVDAPTSDVGGGIRIAVHNALYS